MKQEFINKSCQTTRKYMLYPIKVFLNSIITLVFFKFEFKNNFNDTYVVKDKNFPILTIVLLKEKC
jgi:hypothetical protein